MKFIRFTKIQQYRNIVKDICLSSNYIGLDENSNPIYDKYSVKPIIDFVGTVKLHGTNAGVGFDGKNIWSQKRTDIITIENDNMGFAFFVEKNKEIFNNFFQSMDLPKGYSACIFGEWCGKGIQRGIALSELDKMFVIFDIKIIDNEGVPKWKDDNFVENFSKEDNRIFNIHNFPSYNISIDFNFPERSREKLIEITNNVEKECPAGKHFGVHGTGEGIVWKGIYKDNVYRFKVKGEKHSSSKVKTLASVDVEEIKGFREFVDITVTENRLNQGIEQIFISNNETPNINRLGDFIKWIVRDIMVEERDILISNDIDPKKITRYLNQRAKEWFFDKFDC